MPDVARVTIDFLAIPVQHSTMLDRAIRPLIDRPLNALARSLARLGIGANALSIAGAVFGAAAGLAIAQGNYLAALLSIIASRLLDGLDGPVARINGYTAFGGYLDSVCDYVFYAAIPLGFAVAAPANSLPAAVLLASFLLSGASFLAFAAVATQKGLTTNDQGAKSFYYLAGLAEGTETIACFIVMVLWPAGFVPLAYAFAALCALTALARLIVARRLLGDR
jgi:phosphatidylglycerophosphate synthase